MERKRGERDRQTDRKTERQTGRQTGRQAGRQAGRQRQNQTERGNSVLFSFLLFVVELIKKQHGVCRCMVRIHLSLGVALFFLFSQQLHRV